MLAVLQLLATLASTFTLFMRFKPAGAVSPGVVASSDSPRVEVRGKDRQDEDADAKECRRKTGASSSVAIFNRSSSDSSFSGRAPE